MSEESAAPLAESLSKAKSPADYHRSLRLSLRAFDELNAGSAAKLACREGCSLCCWLRVDVFAHEVFLIAQHLRARFPAEELAALMARLERHGGKVLALTPFEHATRNIACPLLENGRCSIYEVRPHACRRHHSLDFAACQFTYDHPTDLDFPGAHDRVLFRTLSEAMQQGIDAYAALGFDTTIYELGTALTEALATPSSWRRWRDGKKAFLRASITPPA